jgi:hypothetical protein
MSKMWRGALCVGAAEERLVTVGSTSAVPTEESVLRLLFFAGVNTVIYRLLWE